MKKFFEEKIQIGYRTPQIDHQEGDVWEEGGITWTIKNGIRRNITKTSELRDQIKLPYLCPHCNRPMKNKFDPKIYRLFGKCFDCIIEEDTEKIIDGTFKNKERAIISKNIPLIVKEYQEQVKEILSHYKSNHYITEIGDIEKWDVTMSDEKLKEIFDKQLEELQKTVDKYYEKEGV